MLAQPGNRQKTGYVRRNGANPFWAGLHGLWSFGETQGFAGSNGTNQRFTNHAYPYRKGWRDAVPWDTTSVLSKNKQGNCIVKTEAAALSFGNSQYIDVLNRGWSDAEGVGIFLDYHYETALAQSTGCSNFQVSGYDISTVNPGTIARVRANYAGGSNSVTLSDSLSNTQGARNRIYGWVKNGSVQVYANGKASTISYNANGMVAATTVLYASSEWGADVTINMLAIWGRMPAPLSPRNAKRLTLHPNPIELFR